ncbi:MAG: hypothetical protein QG653_539 [Patescibacteria group bacterium]|nr:hypothetical protein [Patescibacteria group bacterium]
MKKIHIFLVIVVVFVAGTLLGYFFTVNTPSRNETYTNTENLDLIRITSPLRNATVTNQFVVEGEARGYWYFEASFPVKVFDANGELLGTSIAQAQGDWMTENFVPFSSILSFSPPSTDTGTLVFIKDNPSGLPENDMSVRIPVLFDISQNPKRKVLLYYYKGSQDMDEQGSIECSSKGMVAVERTMPVTMSPIQNTLAILLKGELTDDEKSRGITTQFPLEGVSIQDISFIDGKLVLTFNDPQFKTSGGACRANILRMQIEKTVKQFETVKSVLLKPNEAFQP